MNTNLMSNSLPATLPGRLSRRVAQICNPSVSVKIIANRGDFSDRGCVLSTSRSALQVRRTLTTLTRCGWAIGHSRGPVLVAACRAALPELAVIGLAAGLALLTGCGKGHQNHTVTIPELPSVPVRTQTVENRNSPVVEEVVGTIRARLQATLEAKTSGRITEMPVVLGQRLKAGDLIAHLDAPEIKARLEQAEAGLQQAERDWKRVSSLFDQQAVTRAEYDAADSRHLVAKGAVAEARALMGYVEIRAPFDGVVTRKLADVGDLAAPGKPLVDIEDPSKLQLEADVPEAIADKVQPGARMNIRLSESSGQLAGTVAEIAPIADPTSRTFRVKLDLPSSESATPQGIAPVPHAAPATPKTDFIPHSALPIPHLMSGQFARLLIPVGETTSMRVPASAVVQRGQMEIVFAVEHQRAQLHLVKTGRQLNGETEVLSGLDPGDMVVVDNANLLVDGQPVEAR